MQSLVRHHGPLSSRAGRALHTTNTQPLHLKTQKFLSQRPMLVRAEERSTEIDNAESELARKVAEAERLRAQETFMVVGTGEAECKGCGYTYIPRNGDPEYPIAPGIQFQDLPADWQCPVCGAEKALFARKEKQVAGFAANQGYGLGTNSMTGEQKSLLIYGSLFFFFFLFLAGYFIQ